MKKARIIFLLFALGSGAVFFTMFAQEQEGVLKTWFTSNPDMEVQPNIRSFEAAMPVSPEGTAPVEPWPYAVPGEAQAARLTNPLAATAENVARGAVYYGYYCAFCHGANGDGNGPVGESYVPRPADLRAAKIQGYSDGKLLRAMLMGTGHEPVLTYVVHPEHRWYVVLYVRSLGTAGRRS